MLPQSFNKRAFRLALLISFLLFFGCSHLRVSEPDLPRPISQEQTYSYTRDIKPILEQKCMPCHSCYDAPCQLMQTSHEGLLRGVTKQKVYDSARLLEAEPTRLFMDAQTTEQWRSKGFYSVFNARGGDLDDNLDFSVFYRMIKLGKENAFSPNSSIPDHIKLGLARKNQCRSPGAFTYFAKKRPLQGMPMGMTRVTDQEFSIIEEWVHQGSVVDEVYLPPTEEELERINQWEAFLNREPLKNQLVSRYLYEHLFLAHLYFDELKTGNFFMLVRSYTPPGAPIEPVATVRANDDPGQPIYYRFRKINSIIVHKTHIPYALNKQSMEKFTRWFLDTDWNVEELPPYSTKLEFNPFETFSSIPARSRYEFMLDSGEYFVRCFIRGPVCRGQIATNVVFDRTYVLFQDPDYDLSVTDPGYMKDVEPYMAMPGEEAELTTFDKGWRIHRRKRGKYLKMRGDHYREFEPNGPSLSDIWDGDGLHPDAMLTVYRHFDNTSVVNGFVGATPKTIWVMDYPLLERTYYTLVVNFNVFGDLSHQADTRLYFDLVRSASENNFLRFMPISVRSEMRDSWYRGLLARHRMRRKYQITNEDIDTQIDYQTSEPKQEFVDKISERLKAVRGAPDILNRCPDETCYSPGASPQKQRVEAAMEMLTSRPASEAPFINFMPDLTFLRISDQEGGEEFIYTLVRDREHKNVAFLLAEKRRLEPEKDTMIIHEGVLGSYPNFIFNVPITEIGQFAESLNAVGNENDFLDLVETYGIRRTHPDIWENLNWIVDKMREQQPVESGLIDMNRYNNP
jgi:hypothetical protein